MWAVRTVKFCKQIVRAFLYTLATGLWVSVVAMIIAEAYSIIYDPQLLIVLQPAWLGVAFIAIAALGGRRACTKAQEQQSQLQTENADA